MHLPLEGALAVHIRLARPFTVRSARGAQGALPHPYSSAIARFLCGTHVVISARNEVRTFHSYVPLSP